MHSGKTVRPSADLKKNPGVGLKLWRQHPRSFDTDDCHFATRSQ